MNLQNWIGRTEIVEDIARGYDERVRRLASHFVWTSRSKESLTLDVKHDEAQKILLRLIVADADVVVTAAERFSGNAKRSAARTELSALIVQAFSGFTAEQVAARLEQAGIANAQVNSMAEVWAHPQLEARDRWREVGTSVGTIPALLPPGSWQHGAPRMDDVPALGQHTDAILGRHGFSAEQIAALRAEGVV